MKITKVSYSRLFALPNFENERVEMVAEVGSEECAEEVLRKLKEQVGLGDGDQVAPPVLDGYPLRVPGGAVGEIIQSADQWIAKLEQVLPLSVNARGFVNANTDVFMQVKDEAKKSMNPRALERVEKVERQMAEYLK